MSPWARVLLGTTAAVVVLAPAPTTGQTSDPVVSLDRTGTAAGEQLVVSGTGWPAGASLVIELCGHGGLRGSSDCDVPHQRVAGVAATGEFSAPLTVGLPPTPCPCVVKATDQTSNLSATAPIAVQGVPTVPIDESTLDLPVRRIEISSIEVSGGSWTEWFGVPAERTVTVTLANTGDVNIDQPAVAIAWGRGDPPTGLVGAPALESMAPGETQRFETPLPASGLAFGRRTAEVVVQGLAESTVARESVTTYPWALLAIGLALLQLVLLRIRNRVRRRVAPEPVPAGGPGPGGPGSTGEVIDLRPVLGPPVPVQEVIDLTNGRREIKTNGSSPDGTHEDPAPESHLEAEVATVAAVLPPSEPAPREADTTSSAQIAAVGAALGAVEARIAELERDALACLAEVDATVEQAQAAAVALMRDAHDVATGARHQIAAALADVRSELAGLRERQQELLDLQRRAASPKKEAAAPTAPLDELDRRLAAAVTRALRSP